MNMIRFGIIGCGMIANWHVKAIKLTDNTVLAGAYDVNEQGARKFCEQYGIRAYDTVDAMLSDVDAVCICTPSGYHAKAAMQVIKAGRHVLIEKPLAMTTEDCDRLILEAKEQKVCAGVICQYRFSPAIQTVKKLTEEGRLGKIITVSLFMLYHRSAEYYAAGRWRGTWALDGGSLMNQGIHGVDAMLYILGDVNSVYGYAKTLVHNIEAEDTAVASLEFKNGAIGVLQSSTAITPGYPRRMIIAGTSGTVSIEDDRIVQCDIEGYTLPQADSCAQSNKGFSNAGDIGLDGHVYQIKDFVRAICENRNPSVSLEDGKRAVALINAVYASSRNKEAILL